MSKLIRKGRRFYRGTTLMAEIEGARPSHKWSKGYTIHYVRDPADRYVDELVGGYVWFNDAVRDASYRLVSANLAKANRRCPRARASRGGSRRAGV